MSLPLDLSITGKATPRVPKETGRRALSANKARNTRSNIFGAEERPRTTVTKKKTDSGLGLPPKAAVISKSQLDAVRALSQRKEDSGPAVVEESRENVRKPNNRKAPEGVPRLQLQGIIEADDQTHSAVPVLKVDVSTPSSRPVSWGTPLSSGRRPTSGKKTRGGGWQVSQNRKLANSPGSSGRKKHEDVPTLDLQLSQSNEGLKELTKTAKMVREDLNIEYIGAAKYQQAHQAERENKSQSEAKSVDDKIGAGNKTLGQNKIALNGKDQGEERPAARTEEPSSPSPLEHLGLNKKSKFVEETLLLDQLAKVAMDDEDFIIEERSYQNGMPNPKSRRHMDLFQSRPVSAASSGSSLVKRLRFGARILSRNGHDALREINGFYFPADSTLTMYEFRQFGTRNSALPFIQRGCYPRVRGPKDEEPYNLADIDVGNTLHFATKCHPSLPANLTANPVISFRITDVDKASREDLLYEGCHGTKDREGRNRWVASYTSEEDRTSLMYLEQVQELLRDKLRNRATKTLTNLGKHFRKLEKGTDKSLELEDLDTALKLYRLELPDEDLLTVWKIVHHMAVNVIDYVDMMRALFGEMSEPRKALVRKAFVRLDPSKTGSVKAAMMSKFFTARKHPKVLQGVATEAAVVAEFLAHFDETQKNGDISFREFEEYYEGQSLDCPSDPEFALMMRNTWGV